MAPSNKTVKAIRELALSYPDTEEGIACEGTSLEKRTVKVRNKAFLFIGPADFMLKLGDSLPDAMLRAASHPEQYNAGATGWVTVKFGVQSPPLKLLQKWIKESYSLMTPKQPATAPTKKTESARANRKKGKP